MEDVSAWQALSGRASGRHLLTADDAHAIGALQVGGAGVGQAREARGDGAEAQKVGDALAEVAERGVEVAHLRAH
eukprot:67060-Chlamydomonas_euryale.AAC.1